MAVRISVFITEPTQQPDQYEPTITSYDYDALVRSRDSREKYLAVRDVIARYADIGELTLPEPIAAKAYGRVNMTGHVLLSHLMLTTAVNSTCPEPMEKLGQDYGFILYSTRISGPREKQELVVQHVRDER